MYDRPPMPTEREQLRAALRRLVGSDYGAVKKVAGRTADLSSSRLSEMLTKGKALTIENVDQVLEAIGATWDDLMREAGSTAVRDPSSLAPAVSAEDLSWSVELLRKLFDAFKDDEHALETLYSVLTSVGWRDRERMSPTEMFKLLEPFMRREKGTG